MIDQIKIGKFIAAKRKEKSLTQTEVAKRLGITDRAVSKWERGLALPDASIMLNLCSILGINITELLTGEEAMEEDYKDLLTGEEAMEEDYKDKAEKLILEIRKKEEENNRYLLRLETVIGVLATVSCLTIIFTAAFLTPGTVLMSFLVLIALLILFIGIYFALNIERDAGYYECRSCHHRYVPDFNHVVMAMHIGRVRLMKCPSCGKRTWQKKVLSR